MKYEIQMPRYS